MKLTSPTLLVSTPVVAAQISQDGDYSAVLDVLALDVGIAGMFSDWPATTTYYANCIGL